MKPFLFPIFLGIIACLGLSGCLTIKESYSFKRNGSGSMSYSVSFDQLDETFAGMQEELLPGDWSFDKMAEAISRVPGISNIQLTEESGGRGFGIAFKFDNLTSLNHALSRMMLSDTTEVFSYFQKEGNLWVRQHKADKIRFSEAFMSKSRDESQVAALLNQLSYEVEVAFKKPIAVAYSAGKGRITGSRHKQFSTQVTLSALSQSPEILNSTILLD